MISVPGRPPGGARDKARAVWDLGSGIWGLEVVRGAWRVTPGRTRVVLSVSFSDVLALEIALDSPPH